ncbi:tail fiber protein [Paenibacillus illinoisensis]|uniref:tail fiber protein n=1 Tax=Paenibacillus illinoisensis TaxID=59845 RepID=UPI00301D5EF3
MAKTDWTMVDEVKPSDMNQIGTEINELRDDINNIPAASTTVAGIAKLNNATTSTSQTDAATPKAVNDARLAAATDATTKANTAETNAKNYVDGKTWQKYKLTQDNGASIFLGTTDVNNLKTAGIYSVFSNSANIPTPDDYFIKVTVYTDPGTIYIKQEATIFTKHAYYQRSATINATTGSGSWTAWSPDVFQSGVDAKQGVVNAINAKGGSASMSDTWAQLAAKINAIQTGPKYASGVATSTSDDQRIQISWEKKPNSLMNYFVVNNLTFRPNRIIVRDPSFRAAAFVYTTKSRNGAGGYNLFGVTSYYGNQDESVLVYELTGQNTTQSAYVNDTGFLLPCLTGALTSGIEWEAFGV